MLETAVGDGAEKLRLQQEIPEPSRVNADITAFFVRVTSRDGQVALLCRGPVGGCWRRRRRIICLELLVRVVNEVFFVGHLVG